MDNTAYWIRKTHLFLNDEFICSNCQKNAMSPFEQCPHCGSVMTGEKKDSNWVDEACLIDIFCDD